MIENHDVQTATEGEFQSFRLRGFAVFCCSRMPKDRTQRALTDRIIGVQQFLELPKSYFCGETFAKEPYVKNRHRVYFYLLL